MNKINNHPPVSNTKYICDNGVASTAFYKRFKTVGCNSKRSMIIGMKILQIAYDAAML